MTFRPNHQRPLRMKSTARRRRLRRVQFTFIDNQFSYALATRREREYLFSSMGVPPEVYAGVRS